MGTFLQDMGIRIAVRRKELGMTQEDLARRVQLTPQTISSAECGKKGIETGKHCKIKYSFMLHNRLPHVRKKDQHVPTLFK